MGEKQKLTVICGNAGVGKTTLGKKLALNQGAALLDIDTVSECLVIAGLTAQGLNPADRDSPEYKATYREAIHETLFRIAEENLATVPCVIVAPFTKERRQSDFLARLEERHQCPVEVIYMTCSDGERKRRIVARGNPRDAAKLQDWDSYAEAGRDANVPVFPHTLIESDA